MYKNDKYYNKGLESGNMISANISLPCKAPLHIISRNTLLDSRVSEQGGRGGAWGGKCGNREDGKQGFPMYRERREINHPCPPPRAPHIYTAMITD